MLLEGSLDLQKATTQVHSIPPVHGYCKSTFFLPRAHFYEICVADIKHRELGMRFTSLLLSWSGWPDKKGYCREMPTTWGSCEDSSFLTCFPGDSLGQCSVTVAQISNF